MAKEKHVEEISKETAQQMDVNSTQTQEEFANSKMLDALALNNELNSKAGGEIRIRVTKKDVYEFEAKDKDGKVEKDDAGEVKMIKSPYVEVTGEGVQGRVSTKRLSKQDIETLVVGTDYYAHFILTGNFEVTITSIVPFNQELKTRLNQLYKGA